MLTKLVFTLAVIGVVILLVRFRGRPARAPVQVPPARSGAPWMKGLALGVVTLMVLGSALGFWLYWRDAHQVMQVWVIDSQTGHRSEYRAYRGSLEGRSFETLDGRRVRLAETERLEVASE
ncbi:hypothetical protein [Thiolapillus sp.]